MIQVKQIIQALADSGTAQEMITKLPDSIADTIINGAAIDSRQVIPGAMFVALSGEHTDGHRFVGNAFNNKALLALVEKDIPEFTLLDLRTGQHQGDIEGITFPVCLRVDNTLTALQKVAAYWRSHLNLHVIGITGSVGKSSTKEVTANVLQQRYSVLKNHGNLNNEIGLPLTILEAGMGHQLAVLEMGFYVPGEIRQLCEIARPVVGVVTNVGTVHAERAGSQEIIARGKAELVESLPPEGTAILNMDDPFVKAMAKKTAANVFFYGTNPSANLWADHIQGLGLAGIRVDLHYQGEVQTLEIPILGRHSVQTILRAAAVGLVEGLTWQEITAGFSQSQSQLRMASTKAWNGALILDDSYNAAPESTMAALDLLAEINPTMHRHVAILGEMYELGPYEQQGHVLVGKRASETCDLLIAVGDRSKIIAEAAIQSGMNPQSIQWMPTVQDAIGFLKTCLRENDVLLIKGSHGLRMDRITWALETNV